MEDLTIVDGYNVLHAWPELEKLSRSSLEHARIRLVDALHNYQGFKGCQVIAVFDAYCVKNKVETMEKLGKLEVIYSSEGQTADMVIEKLVAEWVDRRRVYVVTSDFNEQKFIFGKGAYRISARELVLELQKLTMNANFLVSNEPHLRNNELAYRLKGPVKEIFEKWRREK